MFDDEHFMGRALQEAFKAFDEGETPVGAVIVHDSRIIGRGYNRMEALIDATAHAEIIAISAAAQSMHSWRLADCTIYVTIEPCLMCLGALLQSRISRIVYGAPEPRTGAVDSFFYRQEIERSYSYYPQVKSGVNSAQCSGLMKKFFEQIRKKS